MEMEVVNLEVEEVQVERETELLQKLEVANLENNLLLMQLNLPINNKKLISSLINQLLNLLRNLNLKVNLLLTAQLCKFHATSTMKSKNLKTSK